MNKTKDILGMNAFFMVNKKLVRLLSFEAALFLSILADAEDIFDGDWIYQTQPTIEKISCGILTRRKQEKAIKELSGVGIIEQKNMGLPMKRYFRLSYDNLITLLSRSE